MKDSPLTAAAYDLFMMPLEPLMIRKWRSILWNRIKPPRILEVGVGTGLNIPFYPKEFEITALDKNKHFLDRARRRAAKRKLDVEFVLGDVQNLPFAGNTFDSIVTAFLFCQLRDPLPGLQELYRVLKPGGRLLMLEHVRPKGRLENMISSLSGPIYLLTGEHIAHDTDSYAEEAGFSGVSSQLLLLNIVKLFEAKKQAGRE